MSEQGNNPHDAMVVCASDEDQPAQGGKRAYASIEEASDIDLSSVFDANVSLGEAFATLADHHRKMQAVLKKQRTEEAKEPGLEGGSVQEVDKASAAWPLFPPHHILQRRAAEKARAAAAKKKKAGRGPVLNNQQMELADRTGADNGNVQKADERTGPDNLIRPTPAIVKSPVPGHDDGQPPVSDEQLMETVEDPDLDSQSIQKAYQASASDHLIRPAPGIVRPLNPRTLVVDSLGLMLPDLDVGIEISWQSRFVYWVQTLCFLNSRAAKSMTPQTALIAFEDYVIHHRLLSLPAKQRARERAGSIVYRFGQDVALATEMVAAACAALELTTGDEAENKSVTTGRVASSPANDNASTATSQRPVFNARAEMAKQKRCYPSAANQPTCLNCSGEGHEAAECLRQECRYCGDMNHWHYCCPTRERCSNCRQLGHSTGDCKEEQAASKTQHVNCAFCGGDDHVERDCMDPWSDMDAKMKTIGRMVHAPVSCASCGAGDHVWSDCPAREDTSDPFQTMDSDGDDRSVTLEAETPIEASRDAVSSVHSPSPEVEFILHRRETTSGRRRGGWRRDGWRLGAIAPTTNAMPRVSFDFPPVDATRGRPTGRRVYLG
ncbi:hypothetical protein CDD80_7520 [Ophiocordyceps camponoti-rufipedis]|uniref:CCHC-type domain-containing protein n=1 Tax=Ophiocordyceps camponoti-rufipedis TaxID=2004952 RepID=A0A2C5XDH6_9HYPO|nr:hypothetical protein CDD80_7520 [Ophiocordyceps camponoti-rufipedis]